MGVEGGSKVRARALRFGETLFCNARNAPTQFNLPKYIHYLRQFLFLRLRFRLD